MILYRFIKREQGDAYNFSELQKLNLDPVHLQQGSSGKEFGADPNSPPTKPAPNKPDKNIPVKPDKNPDPTQPKPGGNEPEKNDPTRIEEPSKTDPTRIDEPSEPSPSTPKKIQNI